MSVKVAVRVRPFNQRETERGSKCCIDMVNNTKLLIPSIRTVQRPSSLTQLKMPPRHSLLITVFGHMMVSKSQLTEEMLPLGQDTQIKLQSTIALESKCWITLGRATIVACLHMAKLAVGSPILW